MHFFALLLFFAFAVMALGMLGERGYRRLRGARPLLFGGWGVALAWLANLNMWSGWAIGNLRYPWVGVTLTGVAVGGTALLIHSVLGFFFGMHRKLDDQAEQIERSEIRRVA
jgi:hypothetical protein